MRRVALCVGVQRYDDAAIPSLHCAARDAEVICHTLEQLGFAAERMTHGVGADAIYDKLQAMGSSLQPGDVFLFFFAGHGFTHEPQQASADQLLLLPRASKRELDFGAVSSAGLLSWRAILARTGAWEGVRRLFVFDACRSPLDAPGHTRSGPGGAAPAATGFEGASVFPDMKRKITSRSADSERAVLNSCNDGQPNPNSSWPKDHRPDCSIATQ